MTDKKSDGFTLIETVITLVVLSIAAVGVLSVFSTGITGSANPLILNQATQLARGELDQVFGEKKLPGGFGTIASGVCVLTLLPGFTSCTRTVCNVPAGDLTDTLTCGAATDYKLVTVTVNHPVTGNISMDSLVTHY